MGNPSLTLRLPFNGVYPITQPFGVLEPYKYGQIKHEGIDYGLPCGTPVVAAADGMVAMVVLETSGSDFGTHIIIDHGLGKTKYAHLSVADAEVGQDVVAGQHIGMSGKSGYVLGKTGCHLHFGLFIDSKYVDPQAYMNNEQPVPRTIPEPTDKLVAVHRLYNPETKDHFYTTSADEADVAIQKAGYRDEGILGFVHAGHSAESTD